jgi:hypothetical protein
MKKYLLITVSFLLFSLQSFSQKVNDKALVEYNGTWYNATILQINDTDKLFYISYDGWSESWNEWVGKDRIKVGVAPAPKAEEPAAPAPKKFKVGDRVEVEYGMVPEPATIIEVGENKYHIKYDKEMFGDKWVTERQIKKL